MLKIFSKKDRNQASLFLLKKHMRLDEKFDIVLDTGSRDGLLLRAIGEGFGASKLIAIDWHNRIENEVEFLSHNLENILPFDDKYFDVVICNDVLEHVEQKKKLFAELLRASKQYVIISLPNTQHWTYIKGLIRGNMSKQYNFLVEDGVDRHRWVTYYDQNIEFVSQNAGEKYVVVDMINTVPTKMIPIWFAKIFMRFCTFNQVFLLKRR